MSEMVERVAKAIAVAGNGGAWDDWYNEDQKEFHRKRARVAIEAMKGPDVRVAYYPGENLYSGGFWDNMIDEILK